MFIGEKVNYNGPLLVAVPSEGCLGQRVVDQILSSEKSFKFVGSFDHPSLQPMVGYTDEGRLVTCMELYYSEPLKCGAVQIRAPPTNIKGFVADFAAWFANSGFERLVAIAGAQCSFPLEPVMSCGANVADTTSAARETSLDFVKQSVRRAGFSKLLIRDAKADLFFTTDIFNVEPMVRVICDVMKMTYRDFMSVEHLRIDEPPIGIF